MRGRLVLLLVLLATGAPGCGLVHNGTCTLSSQLKQSFEDCAELMRNCKLADQAWEELEKCSGKGSLSKDYEKGFKDGFASYLYRGGCGEPPPLPPQCYRCLKYQTPEGYQAVLDWFAGYRHGAAAARQSGYRELVTGPSALRVPVPGATAVVEAPLHPEMSPGTAPTPVPTPGAIPSTLPMPLPAPSAEPSTDSPQQRRWNLTISFTPPWSTDESGGR